MEKKNYLRFLFMLLLSFIIMYSVMFLNVESTDHIDFSITRFYMTLLMVTPMALVMLLLMSAMYNNKRLNMIIAAAGILIFFAALILLRTQTLIGDEQYMRAMIPHHSSAILNSREADIKDPEVKKLAEQIIKSQKEEIAQMKEILERMKE